MVSINRFFKITDVKSKTVFRNAFYSFFIKGLNVSVNFLTVPLVLTFLNTTQYGVWLTLTAIIGWFSLFDLGFGNGLRNHLTVAIANKDFKEGKIYVSTTYAALTVIFGSLILLFLVIHPFVNWVAVFNAPVSMANDINGAVLFAMCFLFVQFIVRLINTVLLSVQRAAMADFTNSMVQVFILAGLYILKLTHCSSLTVVAIVYSVTPVAVFLVISVWLYLTTYANIAPSIVFVKPAYVNKLLKLGLSFFIIQIAALVLYASDNFIIAQLFEPAQVTTYNVGFKYFSIVNIIFTIVLAPFWSMTTQALIEHDWVWIKGSIRKLNFLWAILVVFGLVELTFANPVIKVWSANKVVVPSILSMVLCGYFAVSNYGSIYANFLNGVGKIRVQLYFSVVGMVLNIPFAIFLVRVLKLGIIGVPIATIFTMFISTVLAFIQTRKILSSSASGIWNK